jgi:hypothetical protein
MRRLRRDAAAKKASADARCTVPKTSAVVVPWRESSSRKNSATSAAWAASAKRASSGNVQFSSQCSRLCPGLAMTSVCE